MLEIFKVIRQVYYHHLIDTPGQAWSEEFRAGYRHCVDLVLIGMQRHPAYNLHRQNQQLHQQVSDLKTALTQARLKVSRAAHGRRIVRSLSETNHALNLELADQKELIHQLNQLLGEHQSDEAIKPLARLVARYLCSKELSRGLQSRLPQGR